MIGIPESELSRAQADVELRLSARVDCGSVNDVLRTASTKKKIKKKGLRNLYAKTPLSYNISYILETTR